MTRSSHDSFASDSLLSERRNSAATTTDDDDEDSLFSSSSLSRLKLSPHSSCEGDESETDTVVTVPSHSDLKSFFGNTTYVNQKPSSINGGSTNLVHTLSNLEEHIRLSQQDAVKQSRQVTEMKQHLNKLKFDHDVRLTADSIPLPLRQKMIARIDDFFNQQHKDGLPKSLTKDLSDQLQHLNRRQLVDQLMSFQQKYSDLTQDVDILKRDHQRLEGTISVQQTMHASLIEKIDSVVEEFQNECDVQGTSYFISLASDTNEHVDPSQPLLLRDHTIHTHQIAFLHHLRRQLDTYHFPTESVGPIDQQGEDNTHILRSKLITAENQLATQQELQNDQIHQLSLQLATQNELIQNLKLKNMQLEEENRMLSEQTSQAQNIASHQDHKVQVLERKLEQSVQQAARISANLQTERAQWSTKMEQELEALENRKRQALATAQKAIDDRDQVIRDLKLKGTTSIYLGQEPDVNQISERCERLKYENEEMEKTIHRLRVEVSTTDEELSYVKQQCERKDLQIRKLETSVKASCQNGTNFQDSDSLVDGRKVQMLIALKDEADLNSLKMEQERHKAVEAAKALKIELRNVVAKLKQSKMDNAKLESTMLQCVNGNDMVKNKIDYLQDELAQADKRVAQAEKEKAEWELRTEVAKSETRKLGNQHQTLVDELSSQNENSMETMNHLQNNVMELDMALSKAQKQNQETQSVLSAVQSSLAEREGEISLIKIQLTRQIKDHEVIITSKQKVHQTALDRLQRQHEEELDRLRKLLADQHESNANRNKDIAYLQTARHVHMLEDKIKELEYTMESTYQQAQQQIQILEQRLHKEHAQASEAIERWESKERNWRMQLAGVEAEYWRRDSKIKEMEQEVVRLYSKNLELIKELAKWTP
ncbi:hypothetical protein INT44_000828 [Umbelopsis vinacea]|uniref:Uncharacterized protein n=1 Tax=Umbelopsis vinacea TaxID=44442 RepID=A0A8H7UNC4_9FUNG|nr:hypothetical protein INT44_000828 [Umbelopsis vinacea]